MVKLSMEHIVSLAKRRGFIYQHDELYGGMGSVWDYGPYGSLMKENIKRAFIKRFVQDRDDVVLVDTGILTKPDVFKASGHIDNFIDPLVECKKCNQRFRADHVAEVKSQMSKVKSTDQNSKIELTKEESELLYCSDEKEHEFTKQKNFNLMFSTALGAVENPEQSRTDTTDLAYLRPETAQGMFTNFANVLDSTRRKLPFGIAQIGRSFRNEITTGNFNFRAREFEIAEIEYFVKAGEDEKWYSECISLWEQFLYSLGIKEGSLHHREHEKDKLAHYSKGTTDIEYDFPFGRGEIAGIANRTDFDLKAHQKASCKSLEVFDEQSGEKYLPYVIEPTLGVDRILLALLCDAIEFFPLGRKKQIKNSEFIIKNQVQNLKLEEAEGEGQQEIVLHLDPKIAPIQVAVLPLSKKVELTEPAKKIAQELKKEFMVEYDETGSIGKRYRRQDEIGTPLCVTYDFDSVNDKMVTVRNRDTMEQDRVLVTELSKYISVELENW